MAGRLGTIRSVDIGELGRGNSFYLNFEFESGHVQGFGGYGLGKPGSWVEQNLVRELTAFFGVTEFKQIAGKKAIALYESAGYGRIIGIQNPETGLTWDIEEWSLRIAVGDKLLGDRAYE